jgi:hypothetical protein
MTEIKSFKNWMLDQYEAEDLQAIADHGCASACVGGMIYYNETSKIYDEFADDLHAMIGEWIEQVGEDPKYITENIGNVYHFKNAVVWFCAEIIAQDHMYQVS